MKRIKTNPGLFGLLILSFWLISCQSDPPIPKPIGYFRIDLPKSSYQEKTPPCPFSFEASDLSRLEFFSSEKQGNQCWFDLHYPSLKAKVHLTYKPLNGDLRNFLEESRKLAYEHQIKANSIRNIPVVNDENGVYGLVFDLGGSVASPYQFYLTDSTKHFLRGSLYFTARPNPDSLQPALEYVKSDMQHFISTFKWQD